MYRKVIRIRLNAGPPAKAPPLKLSLKEGCKHIRAKPRSYSTENRTFLRNYTNKSVKYGFARPAISSPWVCAPLIVPKKTPALYRMTVDYRPINAATKPLTWPMLQIDAVLSDMRGAKAFSGIDFFSVYW